MAAVTQPGLESTDRRIVELLAADGRMSFTDLGKATGLSTSAVHQRVKRLEQRGLITGYGAAVDHEAMGLPLDRWAALAAAAARDDAARRSAAIGSTSRARHHSWPLSGSVAIGS